MENNYTHPPEETGLADELNSYYKYQPATVLQRFLNFFIDNLLMRYGLSQLTGYLLGYILSVVAPDFLMSIATESEDSFNLILLGLLLSYLNFILYYTFCEVAFKGYTLGKLITGTRAVREDGTNLRFKDALLRSLSRIVPFEPFSAFGGNPWHDIWTKTRVIKSR